MSHSAARPFASVESIHTAAFKACLVVLVLAAPVLVRAQPTVGGADHNPLSKSSPIVRAARAIERASEERAARRTTNQYDEYFQKFSKRYFGPEFDWRYFKAQAMAESELNPNAKSWVGARGLMQLMPSTYREITSRRPEFGAIDDPRWNIAAGVMHDRYLWGLWKDPIPGDERHRFMFGSYNAGEGTISRALATARAQRLDPRWSGVERIAPKMTRWRYRETLGYVRKIDASYLRLKATR